MLNLADLKKDITLAPYTTYQIGGPADYFFTAQTKTDLVDAVHEAKKNAIPFFILGTGANILVGDKGFRGLVVHNQAKGVRFEEAQLITESGATIANLIKESADRGLSGLEHFAGIPSSVGGATAKDVREIIALVQEEVKKDSGYVLEPEISFIGDF